MEETASAHSPIGGSVYSRIKNCPGSARRAEGLVRIQSPYAEKGTAAHEWAAARLRSLQKGEPELFRLVEEDEVPAVDMYVQHVRSLIEPGCVQVYEHRFHLASIHPELFGTADAVTYYPARKHLIVTDYKHGAGVFVDVKDNDQLLYYALGVLLTLHYEVETIELQIVQPNIGYAEPIRKWETDLFRLWEFGGELMVVVEKAKADNAPLFDGDHCRFCPVAAVDKCPLLQQRRQQVITSDFSNVGGKLADYEKLADTLDMLPQLEAQITALRQFAYSEAMKGIEIPRHKLVDIRGRRSWESRDMAELVLTKLGIPLHLIWKEQDPKFISPAQVEALDLKQLQIPYLKKDVKELVSRLVEKKSSGLALVPSTDDRPARSAVVLAQDVFTPITKTEN